MLLLYLFIYVNKYVYITHSRCDTALTRVMKLDQNRQKICTMYREVGGEDRDPLVVLAIHVM